VTVFVIDSCASAELPLIRQFTSRISRSIRFSVFMLTIMCLRWVTIDSSIYVTNFALYPVFSIYAHNQIKVFLERAFLWPICRTSAVKLLALSQVSSLTSKSQRYYLPVKSSLPSWNVSRCHSLPSILS